MKERSNAYVWVGLLLVAAFVLQNALGLRWEWLAERQRDPTYKRWSGLVLALYISAQWALTALRVRQRWREAKRAYTLHKYLGVLAPLFFYAHAQSFGYAYLLVLSVTYFATVLVGILNQELLPFRRRWIGDVWMLIHVGCSAMMVLLSAYHVFISFYYS